jgi:hypothetical protein
MAILFQDGVQDGVRAVVRKFVGMTFTDGFGRDDVVS